MHPHSPAPTERLEEEPLTSRMRPLAPHSFMSRVPPHVVQTIRLFSTLDYPAKSKGENFNGLVTISCVLNSCLRGREREIPTEDELWESSGGSQRDNKVRMNTFEVNVGLHNNYAIQCSPGPLHSYLGREIMQQKVGYHRGRMIARSWQPLGPPSGDSNPSAERCRRDEPPSPTALGALRGPRLLKI